MLAVSQCENWILLAVSNNNRDLQRHVKEKLSLLNWSKGLREIRLTFLPENLTGFLLCFTKAFVHDQDFRQGKCCFVQLDEREDYYL